MSRFALGRPSPALIVATIALIVAMGGTSYAALSVPKNSVGTKQLKKGAVTTSKIQQGSVTGTLIAKNTITGANINLSALGTVPTATNAGHASSADTATNAANATNANHASNADNAASAAALGSVTYMFDPSAGPIDVPACSDNPCTPGDQGTTGAVALCPAGLVAIGGGGETADVGVELAGSFPVEYGGATEPNGWEVDADNWLQTMSTVDYYVECASVKNVVTPYGLGDASSASVRRIAKVRVVSALRP
jgi:hypothetical protein